MQDSNTMSDNVNTELNYISERLYVHKLSLNTNKNKYMFHFAQRGISDIKLTVQIDGQPTERVRKFKF